jgi:hypothetical protein
LYKGIDMLPSYAALAILGLLALTVAFGLNGGSPAVSGLLPSAGEFEPMVHVKNGQPLTLEVVQKDVVWHRDTLRKLRELD